MTSAGTVPAGTRVGRYEIVSLLGRGGMGEVYAAHDENLGRRVALKILPSDRTSDPERVARFVREAKASSALNHPSIVAVHDAGSEGNVHFLAMELIDGESLSAWMTSRRATRRRAIEVMAQVAEGLDRAHANGIVHRDLKPDNIMVSRDGYAKIVDFGVAKLTERANGRRGHTGITTPTSRIGTTAYMSPEQIEGRAVDHRADVFSFGVLLYELLAGKNPFASPQYADTLHNIVHLEPSLDAIPPNLRRIVRRCLRKEPDERYQSMKDAALDLREAAAEQNEQRRRSRVPVLLGTLLLLIGVLATWKIATSGAPATEPAAAAPAMLMTRLTNSGQVRSATISPDGKYLVYAEDEGDLQEMKVKQVATGTTTTILEAAPAYYYNLRVSPDSNYIYYSSTTRHEPNIVHIYQLPLLGGTPRRIAADTEHSFSLSPDGQKIVFTRMNVISREFLMTVANVDGGEEEVLLRRVKPDTIGGAVWAPDGRSITFIEENINRRSDGGLRRLDLATNTIERVVTPKWPGVGSYRWLPDGSGLLLTAFERDQPPQIWFAPTGSTVGRKITSEISAYYQVTPTADSRSFVTVRDTTDANVVAMSIDDPAGSASAVTTGFGNISGSNGVRWLGQNRLIYSEIAGKKNTYFVTDLERGTTQQLVRNVGMWAADVSPDGSTIAFVSNESGQGQIWLADADGSNVRQLTSGSASGRPSFSHDGRWIYYIAGESQRGFRIRVDGTGEPEQVTTVPVSRIAPSADGKWVLCRVRSTAKDGGALWRTAILPFNGGEPVRYFDVPQFGSGPQFQWHPQANGFLYLDAKDGIGNLWFQPVNGSAPRQMTKFSSGAIFAFHLARDGKSLLMSRGEPTSDAVLVTNWR